MSNQMELVSTLKEILDRFALNYEVSTSNYRCGFCGHSTPHTDSNILYYHWSHPHFHEMHCPILRLSILTGYDKE